MKIINIIIEARMNSTRLPGKHLLKVRNMPILEFLVKRLKKVKKFTNIILATTNTKKDDVLVDLAKKNKVLFYRGSEDNVMERVLKASIKFQVGNNLILRETLRSLVNNQYCRNDIDISRGNFRLKGDVLEIGPAYEDRLVRIELFVGWR